jgi:UbiD family decarboxylase
VTIRQFLDQDKELVRIDAPVSSQLEAAGILAALDGKPVLLTNVDGGWRVLSGLCASRERIARCLGVSSTDLLLVLAQAMDTPAPPPLVPSAPCQEVVMEPPDLRELPILKHLEGDGGPYITAGVAIIEDPEYGRNACFHRLMVIGPREMVARVVEGRGTHTAWSRTRADLPIAIAIGAPLSVLLAASMSPPKGVDELAIAHAISPIELVPCRTVPLAVPAQAEIVIEGRLTHRLAPEGPFIDLTETWDIVRDQPVLEVDCITHRRDAIYHAVLPGKSEHKTLMGLPREPGILRAVAQVCEVLDAKLTQGGMSWLHAVVKIRKRHPEDGPRAIRAAMEGHPSLKMVIVVDEDIDIQDWRQVEWAVATRVQAGRDVYIYTGLPSSSLDPSARQVPGQRATSDKVGVDATIPWPAEASEEAIAAVKQRFRRVSYPKVNLSQYLKPTP